MRSTFLKYAFMLQNLVRIDNGQGLVEYALIVSLIALGMVMSVHNVGVVVYVMYSEISTVVASAA
jgi:Flp pilus assembly pilin Flp